MGSLISYVPSFQESTCFLHAISVLVHDDNARRSGYNCNVSRGNQSRCWQSTSSHYRQKKRGKDNLMNATDILKYGQATALQAIDGFPETAWEKPGACGVWSGNDIIPHLASYEE